VFSFSSF